MLNGEQTLEYMLSIYQESGLSTVPITYNQKKTPPKGWRNRSSEEMWRSADKPSNVALRAGDSKLFFLDPDDSSSEEILNRFWEGRGIVPFRTRTASGRTHSYVRTDFPTGYKTNGKLSIGLGDWRAKFGYGLAAPSLVNGKPYLALNDPREMPYVDFNDLRQLINLTETLKPIGRNVTENCDTTEGDDQNPIIPVPLLIRKTEKEVYRLAEWIASAPKGQPVRSMKWEKYWPSRSECIFSLYMSLIINGQSFETSYAIASLPDKSRDWHEAAYLDAIDALTIDPQRRQEIASLYHSLLKFPGRNGCKDMLVFKALLSLNWMAGDWKAYYTNRDLQLLSARGYNSVRGSIKRLINQYKVINVFVGNGEHSPFEVLINNNEIEKIIINTAKETTPKPVSFAANMIKTPSPELFRRGAIPASMIPMVSVMGLEPLKPAEIADRSELSTPTVYRNLKKAIELGLVNKVKGGWILGENGLVDIEQDFGVETSAVNRANKIEEQREMFRIARSGYMRNQDSGSE